MTPKSLKQSLRQRFFSTTAIILILSLVAPVIQPPVFALEAPTPISPAYGTETTINNYPPLGIPEVSWSTVAGATMYRVQFSPDINFASIALEATTVNTAYTPISMSANLFSDGDWYWRVRVESPSPPGNYSSAMLFTKNWRSFDNAPTLISPGDGDAMDFYEDPTFSWSFVTGAARYRFQIATTFDGFASTPYKWDTLATSYQPSAKLANGTYFWRVVPLDVADHEGQPSEVRSFTLSYGTVAFNGVPTLLEPANFSQPTFTPTFRWHAVKGAQFYRLEYTPDPTCDFAGGLTIAVETRNTSYTPTVAFPNDKEYCWRVRAQSGLSTGEWSEYWRFQKKWDIKPVHLTPTNNYKYGIYPLYTWTPVPGASYYKIEIDPKGDFQPPLFDYGYTTNPFYTPRKYIGTTSSPYYWRVTPYDNNNNPGVTSNVTSFKSYYTSTAPLLAYPYYYYIPNDPNVYGSVELNPVGDPTAPLPVFMWHKPLIPWPNGGTYGNAYRIQVDISSLFPSPWEFDTENLSAVPTETDNFDPPLQIGLDYYWRVCPLDSIAGNCLQNTLNGDEWWSQIWKARFDATLGLTPTNDPTPQLLRPIHGSESVETTPLLEWWPLQNATLYRVQISRDPDFGGSPEIDETVPYPAFTPQTSLAQRSLGKTDYGTFYWRVQAEVGGAWTGWSDTWRFQVASQSEWQLTRSIGNTNNRLIIGTDPDDVVDNYELTSLYASQSNDNWYFGLDVITGSDMTYVLYLDTDHVDGSGASTPPTGRNYNVTTTDAHHPEFAIYIDQIGGAFTADNTWLFSWSFGDWDPFPTSLSELAGGELYFNAGYLELKIPETALNLSVENSSVALIAFSVNTGTGNVQDSVPDDPNAPGSGLLSRFTSVTEHLNLIFPRNHDSGDPGTSSFVPPFLWNFPTGADSDGLGPNPSTTPWAGSVVEVYRDPDYSTRVAEYIYKSSDPYFGHPNSTLLDDLQGDNTYYWRVRPRYLVSGLEVYGVWTRGGSFERAGFIPQNLQTSVTFATPTFSWDMVEGAEAYDLEVATDSNFGAGTVKINVLGTPQNTYTHINALPNDDYFWRVRAVREGRDNPSAKNDWSEVASFTLSLPKPTGLTPNDPGGSSFEKYMPTMCWNHILHESNGVPVLAAWKYRLQVSKDPSFSQGVKTVETEQNCWTLTEGYDDGKYYWRVAMIDGNGNVGEYSDIAVFTKQYPIVTMVSPLDGIISGNPTFTWEPVDGAARYQLEISLYPSFSVVYENIETVNISYTGIKTYDPDARYFWRVRIRDRDGKYGPYTNVSAEGYIAYLPMISRGP